VKEVARTERQKEVYEISTIDFLAGNWLEKLKEIHNDGYSFDISFMNNYLVIKKYYFKGNDEYKNKR